ncbi:MAG: hypothetical protein GQ570_15340 [Helicobacteraceae bacterium]|nr:hypothetical protein [Helicobacteraceae bacterium]
MKIDIEVYASNKLRGEMREKKITTKIMCKLLKDTFDVSLKEQSFNNKIDRAGFSSTFFFQCMYVLDIRLINFDIDNIDIKKKEDKVPS